MEIMDFNAKDLKIVKGEIKALNIFYNETDSKHVKIFSPNAREVGSTPKWGTQIPHALGQVSPVGLTQGSGPLITLNN